MSHVSRLKSSVCLFPAFASLAALAAGCRIERHLLASPGQNQALRVESGDRYYFSLDEDGDDRWDYVCDDPDVMVTVDHEPQKASVRIRIHRGYDGPSTVRFICRRPGEREPVRKFTVTLFKRPGDYACWE